MTTKSATSRKVLTGAVAAATGVAILLGGMGTFARWTGGGTVPGVTAQTGRLTFGTWDYGTWTDQTDTPVADDFLMVPGDTVTRVATVDVTAEGSNLAVDVQFGYGGTNVMPAGLVYDAALLGPDGAPLDLEDIVGTGTQTVRVVQSVTFPADAAATMGEPFRVSDATLSITQVLPGNDAQDG